MQYYKPRILDNNKFQKTNQISKAYQITTERPIDRIFVEVLQRQEPCTFKALLLVEDKKLISSPIMINIQQQFEAFMTGEYITNIFRAYQPSFINYFTSAVGVFRRFDVVLPFENLPDQWASEDVYRRIYRNDTGYTTANNPTDNEFNNILTNQTKWVNIRQEFAISKRKSNDCCC